MRRFQTGRAFNSAQWAYALGYLEWIQPKRTQPRGACERICFLPYLVYGSGLRLAELTNAKLGDLSHYAGEGLDTAFRLLTVVGNGNEARALPQPDAVAVALARHLASRNLPADLKDIDL